jgi:hypothetical protein
MNQYGILLDVLSQHRDNFSEYFQIVSNFDNLQDEDNIEELKFIINKIMCFFKVIKKELQKSK